MGDMTQIDRSDVSRRHVLAGLSATAAFAAAPAFARAPMLNTQAPAYYRFRIGAFEATAVSDGPLHLGEPQPNVFVGMSKEDFAKALADNFLPADNVKLEQNVLVVNTGEKLVMFDTGTGSQKLMGPDTGRLLANLKAAGIDPQDIDAVAITHAHPDHCWGLLGESGARNFPNAQIYIAQADLDFWTDESKLSNDMLKGFVETTRKQLLPNRDRIVFFKDGEEFLPGIQAMAAPGHTPGHTVFMIASQGKTLCNAGDIAHHHVLVPQNPRLEFAFDIDGKQAVASRLKVFDLLAGQRIPLLAYHFPWPGLGHLGRQGEGYRYYPTPIQTTL
jgi:glyoxylase-like metal-dependent hydrolase (beta-lactamase superfamily II)